MLRHNGWHGNMVYHDGSVKMLDTATPDGLTYESGDRGHADNLFSMLDGPGGADEIITFTRTIDPDDGPTLQFD